MTDGTRPAARVVRGGPLIVEGAVPLSRLERGSTAWVLSPVRGTGHTYTLCRCGVSSGMPFCDRQEPFGCFDENPPTGSPPAPFAWELPDGSRPAIALKPDGPARVAGGVPVSDAGSGALFDPGARVSLCRCGMSRTQPLCDGSHKVAGFRDR